MCDCSQNQGVFPEVHLFLTVTKEIHKGCKIYVILAFYEKGEMKVLEHLPVVRELQTSSLRKLLGIPPERELKFTIDLKLGTEPIARMPYWMSTPKLKELKMELKELLDLGLIHHNVSLCYC
jgi:hypothetical protein